MSPLVSLCGLGPDVRLSSKSLRWRSALTVATASLLFALSGCGQRAGSPGAASKAPPTPAAPTGAPQDPQPAAPAPTAVTATNTARSAKRAGRGRVIPRATVNRILAALHEPVFWRADTNGDGRPQATELVVLWSRTSKGDAKDWEKYVKDGRPGVAWARAFNRVRLVHAGGWPWRGLPEAEVARRRAVMRELNQGRPTLIETDFRKAPDHVRSFVGHMAKVGRYIEVLHRSQRGALGLDKEIPERDLPSKAMFDRNQGPWCQAPETEKDATCHGLPSMPKQRSGLYPLALQKQDPNFCETLAKHKDAKRLLSPFVTVQYEKTPPSKVKKAKNARGAKGAKGSKLIAVPYPQAFPNESEAIARELTAAALVMKADPKEAPLVAYLMAAAQAFRDNSWPAADEAWAKMARSSSAWYLRVGPDETYFEPCNRKAGFHMVLARIDPGSAAWKAKLEPRKDDLEGLVAAAAGKPYEARKITFHLPEFIHIVLNAGDSRSATGATVGQSLPNWGPVAEQSRGRTVAMTNLYTDADSRETLKQQTASVFCADAQKHLTFESAPQTMSTVLHEAGHNLGPSHAYKVDGKTGSERFGGPTASILEELKAQTMALAFNPWLVKKKLITQKFGYSGWLRDIAWAFGHISRGMTTSNGKPKAYSQLAAVQVGLLLDAGGLVWKPQSKAANGRDVGCFSADFDKFEKGVAAMATKVYGIKARGDVKGAKALLSRYVTEGSDFAKLRDTVRRRWLRAPRASFVYAIRY